MTLVEGTRDLNSFVDIAIKDEDEVNPIVSASLIQQSSRSYRSLFRVAPQSLSEDEFSSDVDGDTSSNDGHGGDDGDAPSSPISPSSKPFQSPILVKSRSHRSLTPGSIGGETQDTMSLITTDLDTTTINSVNATPHQVVIMDLEQQIASLKNELADAKSQADFYRIQHGQLHAEFEELENFCKQLQQENLTLRKGILQGVMDRKRSETNWNKASEWNQATKRKISRNLTKATEDDEDEDSMPPDMDNCSIAEGFSLAGSNDSPRSQDNEECSVDTDNHVMESRQTSMSEDKAKEQNSEPEKPEGEKSLEEPADPWKRVVHPLFFRRKPRRNKTDDPQKQMKAHARPKFELKGLDTEEASKPLERKSVPDQDPKIFDKERFISDQDEREPEKSLTPRTLTTVKEVDEDAISPSQSTDTNSSSERKPQPTETPEAPSIGGKHRFERRSSNQWDTSERRVSIDASSLVDMCLTDEFIVDEEDCVSELTLETPNPRGLMGLVAKLKRRASSKSPIPTEEESDPEPQQLLGLSPKELA